MSHPEMRNPAGRVRRPAQLLAFFRPHLLDNYQQLLAAALPQSAAYAEVGMV